jgi:hypothetical protein
MVQITRESILDGKTRTIEIPLTESEFSIACYRWAEGDLLIQDAFPTLTPSQREFIKSGITDEQWQDLFGSYDE